MALTSSAEQALYIQALRQKVRKVPKSRAEVEVGIARQSAARCLSNGGVLIKRDMQDWQQSCFLLLLPHILKKPDFSMKAGLSRSKKVPWRISARLTQFWGEYFFPLKSTDNKSTNFSHKQYNREIPRNS